MDVVGLIVLPVGLGLLGFVEPCSIGAALLFLKHIQGRKAADAMAQTAAFVATRGLVIGALGAAAALVGTAFIGFQQLAWLALGALYVAVGALYLGGRSGAIMVRLGPGLDRLAAGRRGAVGLGLLFGLNIPACAAPLLFVVLGAAAVGGAELAAGIARGFVTLGLFGLALSLPIAVAVFWSPARRLLERALAWSTRVPRVIGAVLLGLGAWSIYFGLFVTPRP